VNYVAILTINVLTPLGVADGVLYVLVVLLTSRMSYPQAPRIAAMGCTALIVGAILPLNAWQFSVSFEVAANRGLAILTVWVTMILSSQKQRVVSALEEAEYRHQAVVEQQTEMIVRWRPDRTVSLVNGAICRVLGLGRETISGPDAHAWDNR
jgi:PAS domain-containing protein